MTTPKHLRADNAPPRTGIIAIYATIAALTLLGLKPIFDSYFEAMYSTETSEKVSTQPATELEGIRAREDVLLLEKGVPMDRVRAQLARGRQAAPALIAPQPSSEVAPITGWSALPPFVHTAQPPTPPPPAVAPPPAPDVPPAAPVDVAPTTAPAEAPTAAPAVPSAAPPPTH